MLNRSALKTIMKNTVQRSIQMLVVMGLVLFIAPVVSAQLTGTIEKVWVEHDVTAKGQRGIRVHARYVVKKGRNVYCSMQVYIERADGLSMTPGSKRFRTVYATQFNKSVYLLTEFKPTYDPATFPDAKLFFPYSAFALQEGNLNKMKVTVQLVGEGKVYATSSIDIQYPMGKL